MQITQIKKTNNNLYEITIKKDNEEHTFKITEDFVIKYQLYHNKILSHEEYLLLKSLVNDSTIYTKTLNYISFKMRTEQEVIIYLKGKGCSESYLVEIIEKLKKLNYINDKKYSELYVKYQFSTNKKGPLLIKDELLKKKIKKTLIEESLQYLDPEMIEQNILHLIQYYDKLNKSKSIYKLKESTLRNLLLKGYDYELVNMQLNNYSFTDNNNDDVLLKKEALKALRKYQKKYQDFELKNRVIKSLISKGFIYEDILNALVSINTEG